MGRALAALSAGDEPRREAVDTLFRMAHSIKGMAASLDYDAAAALAHRLEDWMEPLRAGAEVDSVGLALARRGDRRARGDGRVRRRERAMPPAPREDLIARLAHRRAREPAETLASRPRSKKNS